MTDRIQAIKDRLAAAEQARDGKLALTPTLDAVEDFDAHAPGDIAYLLAEVERLDAELKNRIAWLKYAAGCGPFPAAGT